MIVFCGFQDGVDIAAARAAKLVGLETGGYMAAGWRTVAGPRPEYATLYGAKALEDFDYGPRTRRNVAETDATLVIARSTKSSGTRLTIELARRHRRPLLIVPIRNSTVAPEHFAETLGFLMLHSPPRLNVAGNRDRSLEAPVERFLIEVFTEWKRLTAA